MSLTVAGANPVVTTAITDNAGVATFTYQGAKAGTDVLHATALGSTLRARLGVGLGGWIQPASGGAALTQGWIASPADHSTESKLAGAGRRRAVARRHAGVGHA